MMSNEEAIEALLEWVEATVTDVAGKTYKHEPASKTADLPDCVAVLEREGITLDDPEFPIFQMQQVVFRRFDLALSFMVEAGVDPDAAEAAQVTLRSYAEALTLGVLADETLGARVPAASPAVEFDYTPPFLRYDDGTIGRNMTMSIAIGTPLAVGDPLG